jgi:hypothetical protein
VDSEFPSPSLLVYVSILPLSDIYEKNSLSQAARTRDGLDVIIRVIVIGNEGHDHLKILRRIATQERTACSAITMLFPCLQIFSSKISYFIFGIFPKVGGEMLSTYGESAKNSVGDIIQMLMQNFGGKLLLSTSCLFLS